MNEFETQAKAQQAVDETIADVEAGRVPFSVASQILIELASRRYGPRAPSGGLDETKNDPPPK